jgi:serine protease Do
VTRQLILNGRIQRAWLGCEFQPLLKQTQRDQGVLVASVLDDSPAAAAGLKPGDLLLRLAETELHVRHDEEMPALMGLVSQLPIGKPVDVLVWRDGAERNLQVTPREREELRPKQSELKPWGITLRNLSHLAARELKRPNSDGVLVTSVRPSGPANEAKPALPGQDIIVQVNDTTIKNATDLADMTRTLTEDKSERVPVLVTFERKDRRYLTVLRLGLEELEDPGLEAFKAWLPVETQVISREVARQMKQPDVKGFYITRVYSPSSAEKAGLKSGDFIVAVDNEKLTATAPEHEEELPTLIHQYDPDTEVKLAVVRDGRRLTVPVKLERSPRLPREMKKYRNEAFEFTARDMTFYDQAEEQWPTDQAGVIIEEVRPGGWADLGMLYSGDLLLAVDGKTVTNVDAVRSALEDASTGRKPFIVFKVLRGIHTRYLSIEPKWTR